MTPTPPLSSSAVPAAYRPLYKYLNERYADVVVLRFTEVEDLIGQPLPSAARLQREWWATADADHTPSLQSQSWLQASRTAVPNLAAQTVKFERASA